MFADHDTIFNVDGFYFPARAIRAISNILDRYMASHLHRRLASGTDVFHSTDNVYK